MGDLLKHSKFSIELNAFYNVFTHCYFIYNKIIIYIEWIDNKIKQIFNYFVFVLRKTLVENRQNILQDRGRIIEISG